MLPKQPTKGHRFGGEWTTRKLDVLSKYLAAYTTALRNQQFVIGYIDAFAGTGYRTMRVRDDESSSDLLFPDLAATEPQTLLDGSARLALQVDPPFDRYVFIERNRDRCDALEALKDEFPARKDSISIRKDEANRAIRAMCARDWSKRRAVLFLDPYGTQVEWETIEAIAATKAIDMWLLFPLGMGVNRMLTRSGEIPETWRDRLDKLLGTKTWVDAFYETETTPMLFGGENERIVKVSTSTIGRFFNDRLKSIFAGVSDSPAVLRNSTGSPLYLLCFAAANEKGAPIAVRIADHLLKGVA